MFNEMLNTFRHTPIPSQDEALKRKVGYRRYAIAKGVALYEESCGDIASMVYPNHIAGKNHYYRTDNPPYYQRMEGSVEELWARKSVITRLRQVQNTLEQSGLELFIFDAWRPAELQTYCREWFRAKTRELHPSWSDLQVEEEVSKYWAVSPPTFSEIDSESPPPHLTGAAVDCTIRVRGGGSLWMGTIFDDVSKRSHLDFFEHEENVDPSSFSDIEARMNRRLMYWVMHSAGLVVNPTEWWHVSWGDQMWAVLTGAPAAHFGPIDPRERRSICTPNTRNTRTIITPPPRNYGRGNSSSFYGGAKNNQK